VKYFCVLVIAVCVSIGGAALVGGCAPAAPKLTGPARVPIPVEQVMIYDQPPANAQDVAVLHATSHSVFSPGGPSEIDKVVQRLKVQAAQLGANGLVLQGFSDRRTASLGAGAGSESYGRSSAVGVGASGSFGVFKKTGEALAIFVPARAPP
jgi:hypothetical protein